LRLLAILLCSWRARHFGACSLLPPAAQGLIKLDDTDQLIQLDLGESELRLKQVAVGIQGVELSIHAAAITYRGQPRAVLQCGNECLLLYAGFSGSLMRDQSIR